MQSSPFKIAIVGLGPKGLYGLERILSQLKANPVKEKVEIHLFNKTRFMGSGDIYRSDQPAYMLMNFASKQINMWPEESPPPVIKHPLRFSAYIALEKQMSPDEIDPLYASRATVGGYLENGFAQLSQSLPENVILEQHIAEVRSIEKSDEGYSIGFMQQEQICSLTGFQHILITTGHQRHKETAKSNHNTISFIYPVQHKLNGVTERDAVAVKGMGLTFIDAVLALTEGTGGFFTKNMHGDLIYTASGKEPKRIYPFSKSGWPIMPKYDFYVDEDTELYVKSLRSINHKKLSFKNEILPLIERDIEYAYYRTLFSYENFMSTGLSQKTMKVSSSRSGVADLTVHHTNEFTELFSDEEVPGYLPNYEVFQSQIHTFHQQHPGYERFSFERLLEPEFSPAKTIHQNILDYLAAYTLENNRNIEYEAQLRAAAVWRRVSPVFNEIYSFSGLDATSHQEFDSHYFGKLNRIAYGPPPGNLKKILALANAGIVDFQYAKSPNLEPFVNGFILSNGNSESYCDILVDARIPKNSMEKEVTGLFTNLCENHLARPYIHRDTTGSYAPGTLEIDRNGNLINPQGTPENITLYGTPTEGIVHDNDTLARSRNNFAGPWARAVIQHIMSARKNSQHTTVNSQQTVANSQQPNELKKRTTQTYATTKRLDAQTYEGQKATGHPF